jgi:glycosyltransferase involved in cell wall biosynthesis
MSRLVRITTVPISLTVLLKGQMKFMKEQGFEVTMISSSGPEVETLKKQEGCDFITVEMTRKITPLKDFIALVRLIRIFRRIRPTIVHSHTPKAGLLGMWAALISGVPIRLHTIAGLPWTETTGLKRYLLQKIESLTSLAACKVYPNSFVQFRFLEKSNIAVGKMKVLGGGSSNGIDTGYFRRLPDIVIKSASLRNDENVSPNAWIWVFVGRIVNDKGIAELMEAFDGLHKLFPQDRLWLIGNEEPELDPISAKYRSWLQSHPAMKWWGYQKDIRAFLAASKVLVFPSYREGFPNVPLQAAAMGCALILSDINGCNEIVNNGKDGLLVPVKNTEALFDAMKKIRNNESMTQAFADAISQKVSKEFDQQKLWNIILNEYRYKMNQISNHS